MLPFGGDGPGLGGVFLRLPDRRDVIADVGEIRGQFPGRQRGVLHVDQPADDILLPAQDGPPRGFRGMGRQHMFHLQGGEGAPGFFQRDPRILQLKQGVLKAAGLPVLALPEVVAPAPDAVHGLSKVDREKVGGKPADEVLGLGG